MFSLNSPQINQQNICNMLDYNDEYNVIKMYERRIMKTKRIHVQAFPDFVAVKLLQVTFSSSLQFCSSPLQNPKHV